MKILYAVQATGNGHLSRHLKLFLTWKITEQLICSLVVTTVTFQSYSS